VREKYLVFGEPVIGDEEISAVTEVLRSRWIGQGSRVREFETRFAAYKSVPHAIAVSSCTAALELALRAANIRPGDEVITTPLTFCATVNAILHAGGRPVLADVDPVTQNIDPAAVASAVTARSRAIVPVHFAGRMCRMSEVMHIAKRHSLSVIEDCAHAIETATPEGEAGAIGDFGCFSFHATKNITCGEGGMVLCKTAEQAGQLSRLALHGITRDAWKRFGDPSRMDYAVEDIGFKANMTDIEAAIGLVQLARVEERLNRRRQIWRAYMEAFSDLPIGLPAPTEPRERHALHLFTILIDENSCGRSRAQVAAHLRQANIGSGIHYRALPEHPAYQSLLGWRPEQTPHATRIGRQTLSLPLTAGMSYTDVADVIAAVRTALGATA
jgi:dTDP-4-amino-4,6-dideoxygalactose transaminase